MIFDVKYGTLSVRLRTSERPRSKLFSQASRELGVTIGVPGGTVRLTPLWHTGSAHRFFEPSKASTFIPTRAIQFQIDIPPIRVCRSGLCREVIFDCALQTVAYNEDVR